MHFQASENDVETAELSLYKKGKELFVADTLSRTALSDLPGMMQEYDVFCVDLAQMDLSPNLVKLGTMNQIREETVKDPSLLKLKKVVLGGWPSQESEVLDEECSSHLIKSQFPHHCNLSSYRRYTKHIKAQIVAYVELGNPFTGQECRQQLGKHVSHVVCVLST